MMIPGFEPDLIFCMLLAVWTKTGSTAPPIGCGCPAARWQVPHPSSPSQGARVQTLRRGCSRKVSLVTHSSGRLIRPKDCSQIWWWCGWWQQPSSWSDYFKNNFKLPEEGGFSLRSWDSLRPSGPSAPYLYTLQHPHPLFPPFALQILKFNSTGY